MAIVLISEALLRRSRVSDGRILRDRVLCGFCVRMNARKRAFKVATSVAGKQFRMTLGYWPLMSVEEARAAAIRETGTRRKSYTTILIDRCPSASKIAYEPNKEALGNVVPVYESGPNSHPGFGELSLMYE